MTKRETHKAKMARKKAQRQQRQEYRLRFKFPELANREDCPETILEFRYELDNRIQYDEATSGTWDVIGHGMWINIHEPEAEMSIIFDEEEIVEDYRLWFEYLKLAYQDPDIKVDKRIGDASVKSIVREVVVEMYEKIGVTPTFTIHRYDREHETRELVMEVGNFVDAYEKEAA